jgi:hypothetical protein
MNSNFYKHTFHSGHNRIHLGHFKTEQLALIIMSKFEAQLKFKDWKTNLTNAIGL